MNDKEAMKLALEALTKTDALCPVGSNEEIYVREAIYAITEALAKQEQRSDSEQLSTECVSVSVGEPVAWYIRDKDSATTDGCWAEKNLDICEPLYTTPPQSAARGLSQQQRKPLTCFDTEKLAKQCGVEWTTRIDKLCKLAAAHGIKE